MEEKRKRKSLSTQLSGPFSGSVEDKKLREMQTTDIWLVKLHKKAMTVSGPFML